ncbi:MAG TPA: C25 family cysteine peptidase, partial [Bacteroidia bacterium]|nr:C25 family cysteine peptidase [Bacteroidia bacterium]
FIDEAEQLAKFHRDNDGLSTLVVTTEQVYNEFSSGAPDVSAIRDMMRMFYKKSIGPQDMPKYLLLIGDGSYDNKNREYSTNNLILTWQSASGCSFTGSYVTDDFFGLLDDDEGNVNSGEEVDIGIGRFPVFTNEQAQVCVDKVINYSTEPGYIVEEASCNNGVRSPLGDWRNTICYVGDDEDSNTHLQHNEIMVSISQQLANEFTVDKIYFDAFQQISTPGGKRYPSVKDAITKRVERGSLLINYAGHGGETGWSEERVLEVSD